MNDAATPLHCDDWPLHCDDWTLDIPDSDHVRFFRSVDWESSALGPLERWSTALRLYTYNVFADSRPATLYWGPEKVAIYNEAFVPLAGKAHPTLMGSRFEDGFSEIWDDIRPVFEGAEASKRAVDVVEIRLDVERNGFTEETYFTGNFNPLRGDDGRVGGFHNALGEVTKQKLNDRRREMLNLASTPTAGHTTDTIGVHIVEALRSNPYDVPFAMLYQVDGAYDISPGSMGSCHLTLKGSIGLPDNDQLLVKEAYMDSEKGLIPLLRKATKDIATIAPGPKFGGVEWVGYGGPSAAISAVSLSESGRLFGYLVVGANPRRPIDVDHDHFLRDLSRHLSSTIAVTVSNGEALKRQQRLMTQLKESERKIRYMAQHLDIGMEHSSLDGRIIWANEHYYTLIGCDPSTIEGAVLPFKSHVLEEDRPLVFEAWKRVVQGEKAHTMEIRMNRQFIPPYGDPVPATVLLSAFPYMEDDEIKSIMACMTDVSRLKWAEAWQARAAQEAQEAKRLQSEFTDAISHEVRNPLSAIFQLADSIAGCMRTGWDHSFNIQDYTQILEDNVEAAKTILICAKHQKRIVDDVLTLSKMDFTLMSLSPTSVNPTDLAEGALKILEADLSGANIKLSMVPDRSLDELQISSVICDSLRVTQIIINLLSNAIKFTGRETKREITMRYGASLSNPRESLPRDIQWASAKRQFQDLTLEEEWGTGEPIYLTFQIKDTGPGMTADDLQRLFRRFEQASPRTSIKYGGSGLGLFISHSLSEKQSGSIGVSSEPGRGSTFAFYIKCRRHNGPATATPEFPFNKTIPSLPTPTVITPGESPFEKEIRAVVSSTASLALSNGSMDRPAPVFSPTYYILLVEDNLVNQKILRRQLKKAGCIIYVANHGVEALEILKTTSRWLGQGEAGKALDIVLMDWEMPVMDGLTCSREIRSLERAQQITSHVEIIAVTANVRPEQVEKAMAAGVDAVLPKPFVVSDLLATIKQRLGR